MIRETDQIVKGVSMETAPHSQHAEDNEPLLGTLLRMPYQAMMSDVVEPGLVAAGYADIRAAYFPAIQTLYRHPEGVWSTDLAARARITKQSMGYLVDYLEARGYAERVPDPSDGRARLIRLTPRGWEMGGAIRHLVMQAEATWADRIGDERVEELRRLLQELVVALGYEARHRP